MTLKTLQPEAFYWTWFLWRCMICTSTNMCCKLPYSWDFHSETRGVWRQKDWKQGRRAVLAASNSRKQHCSCTNHQPCLWPTREGRSACARMQTSDSDGWHKWIMAHSISHQPGSKSPKSLQLSNRRQVTNNYDDPLQENTTNGNSHNSPNMSKHQGHRVCQVRLQHHQHLWFLSFTTFWVWILMAAPVRLWARRYGGLWPSLTAQPRRVGVAIFHRSNWVVERKETWQPFEVWQRRWIWSLRCKVNQVSELNFESFDGFHLPIIIPGNCWIIGSCWIFVPLPPHL